MNPYSLKNFQRPQLKMPNGSKRLLMHSCCAPCAGEIMEAVAASDIDTTIFFYNPNIHPKEEYEIRKNENIRFAEKLGFDFVDADYDKENWFERIKGLEDEPERGERCTICFDMRFERSALFAYENGFDVFATTLGISRWKDLNQINNSGLRAAKRYNIAKRENFYKQEYCGCVYSLRDTNRWRKSNGREIIKRGINFYEIKS